MAMVDGMYLSQDRYGIDASELGLLFCAAGAAMVAFQVGLKRPRAGVGNSRLTQPGLRGGQVCQDGGQALPLGTNAFRLFKKSEQPEV